MDSKQEAVFPLSCSQHGFWLVDQFERGTPASNIALVTNLVGTLDISLLERCVNEIVRRHDALRTTFSADNGKASQVVASCMSISIPLIDFSGAEEQEREHLLRERIEAEGNAGFDLQQGPLLRISVLRSSADHHVLMMVVHHIIFDGWSLGVFHRELEALYGAFLRGQASPLAELTGQFPDFAIKQRQQLYGAKFEKSLAFWKSTLAGVSRIELPNNFPVLAHPDSRASQLEVHLSRELTASLKQMAERENCTRFMLFSAAFKLLLHRYTGQQDILVGVPVSGRLVRDGVRNLIGNFINTVLLRTDLSGDPDFRELLKREKETSLRAYRHAGLPFDRLVEQLRPHRKTGVDPYVDVMINFLEDSWFDLNLAGLEASRARRVARRQSGFALMLEITDRGDTFGLRVIYQLALFDPRQMHDLLNRHFVSLLDGIVANPQGRLSELPLLSSAESHCLLVEWNRATRSFPHDLCVHRLFEQQAARTPDAIALVHEELRLSFAELDARANRLAHHLVELGVVAEQPVAICVERSLEMVVALLGVLKAGGAFVPLDPEYPAERIAFMLKDSAACVLLTQSRLLPRLPHFVTTVCLDTEWAGIERQADRPPVTDARPGNLAYIIYTSGSTGHPKGVAVEHRSISNHCCAIQDHYRLTAADRVFQFASFGFDASINQLLPPLCAGARVVLGKHRVMDPADIIAAVQQNGVTVLSLPPAYFQLWVERHDPGCLPARTLRLIVVAGDKLKRESVQAWKALGLSSTRLVNLYGPTEATIAATIYDIGELPAGGSIPIGRPLYDTRAYVLDRHMQPVPIGVAGELYIGGVRVARGYLNRAELTAEKFVADPFSEAPGARLYRTGDRVRYLADGNIEFLGRMDEQVKIRGYRIEPGEVEAALLKHPAVVEAVVQAREAGDGSRLLAAFIQKRGDAELTLEQTHAFLSRSLPAYMIPGRMFLVNQLPLNANGKVDRRALRDAPLPQAGMRGGRRKPYDTLQATLLEFWSELLGLPQDAIGIQDNFFELGGDSLKVVVLQSGIEKLMRWSIPLPLIYNHPTVEGLAQAMLEHRGQEQGSALVEIQAGTLETPLFFLHGDFHGGGFFCYQVARFMGAEQTLYALQPHGLPGKAMLPTIEVMAAEYVELIREVRPHGPYFIGGHCSGAMVAFEVAQRLLALGERVELLAMLDPSPVSAGESTQRADEEVAAVDLDSLAPERRHEEVMRLYGLVTRRYRPRHYPGKLTLVLAQENVQAWDPTGGWRAVSAQSEIQLVPGNHVSMLTLHAPALARKLVECRNKVRWN